MVGQPRVRAAAAQDTTREGSSARLLAWWPLPGKVAPTFPERAGLQRNPGEGGVRGAQLVRTRSQGRTPPPRTAGGLQRPCPVRGARASAASALPRPPRTWALARSLAEGAHLVLRCRSSARSSFGRREAGCPGRCGRDRVWGHLCARMAGQCKGWKIMLDLYLTWADSHSGWARAREPPSTAPWGHRGGLALARDRRGSTVTHMLCLPLSHPGRMCLGTPPTWAPGSLLQPGHLALPEGTAPPHCHPRESCSTDSLLGLPRCSCTSAKY
ncbi:uncharacterized protein LOC110345752 [Heterocephalus glaber]|uniref:Uncharacterized protein LOC110345752 n=1 Tax=Heterocephalus glaber TaxID=10181 RepID=A0AAX6RSI9_HETGA|nr:uncharacterized protein LOC110345752 [Heterocephalus glaber]